MPLADAKPVCEVFDIALIQRALIDQFQGTRHRRLSATPGCRMGGGFRAAP
ncbi:hypothetical protein [Rhodospirillum sp. A1_3_36]|uniref:hypothetical protein n=1 Tax=Rhodospirillum sp. A1_3_36 TaxID=3391666 RepID=UPI0039A5A326